MNVYTMRGHSCDTTKYYKVPKGCIYITAMNHGQQLWTTDEHDPTKKFLHLFSSNAEILRNPLLHKTQLREVFGEKVQIYYADSPDPFYRKYPNCLYKPLLDWKFDTKNVFEKSGLFQLGNVPHHYAGEILNTKNNLTPKHVKFIYDNSIFPRLDTILGSTNFPIRYETFKEGILQNYEISQRELFKLYPGIYYNFTCRDPCTV